METSQNGLKFIQSFEGCRLSPYLDVGGKPTIGWGMTYYPNNDVDVTMADKPLTQPEADTYFISMVKPYCTGVIEALGGTVINQNQLDALVDFAYNLGVGAFKQSTLCQHVKEGCVVETDFTIYDHVGQTVNNGLLSRRKAEYNLFIQPVVEVAINNPTNQNNTMENQTGAETVAEVQAYPQTVTVTGIAVTFNRVENGQIIQTGATANVTITPELIAALQNPNANLIEGGFNITVAAPLA